MPHIVIERSEGSVADKFRAYHVIIDGENRGRIKARQTCTYEVASGDHTVQLRIDLYSSPPLRVAVVDRTRLRCRSSVAHALGLLALFAPSAWITLHEEDDAGPEEAPSI